MVVVLVAAIQFVNIVDFMMVAPLGPDLAAGLGVATSKIGIIAGSYTFAAATGSLVAAAWLDRLDRRTAVVAALLGMSVATAAAALSVDLLTLVAARVAAGLMAGPASAMAISILMDAVPAERRGRAMGTVMGAFSAASVLGVPAGLELAHWAGWRAPFLIIGALILLLALVTAWRMPSMRAHLAEDPELPDRGKLVALLADYRAWLAYATIGVSVVSGFLLIPNLSTYYQLNMGYPREDIGLLFLVGGSISFFTMRLAGRAADRLGPLAVTITASLAYMAVLYWGFYRAEPWLPVMVLFCAFMISRTTLAVSANTVVSWVPRPRERAAFMSVKNAFQHFAAAGGAFLSSQILSQDEAGALLHVPALTGLAMLLAVGQPICMALLLRGLHERS